MKAPTWLLAPICAAACYRDGAEHPCDGTAPPAYCAAATDDSPSSGPGDTSSSSQPGPPDTTSTSHADSETADAAATSSSSDLDPPPCGADVVRPEHAEQDGSLRGADGCSDPPRSRAVHRD